MSNPTMGPFCSSTAGKFHRMRMDVCDNVITVTSVGGPEGTSEKVNDLKLSYNNIIIANNNSPVYL